MGMNTISNDINEFMYMSMDSKTSYARKFYNDYLDEVSKEIDRLKAIDYAKKLFIYVASSDGGLRKAEFMLANALWHINEYEGLEMIKRANSIKLDLKQYIKIYKTEHGKSALYKLGILFMAAENSASEAEKKAYSELFD